MAISTELGLLDDVYDRLTDLDEVAGAMDELVVGLGELRRRLGPEEREALARSCLEHPLAALLHQDPFTGRAYRKPRGYAGDAVMMDHIYRWPGRADVMGNTTPLGRAIYEYTGDSPSARAVRTRRDLLADMIDEVTDETHGPVILSLACGHLREAQLSRAVGRGRVGRFLALDQDRDSLEVVERTLGCRGIEALPASVLDLLRGRVELPGLDFAYTAGLYDYLAQPLARKLTASLFGRLRPGGRLLIANFLPDIKDAGYMETFMDWKLVFRDAESMEDLADRLPPGEVASTETFVEENRNIIFLLLRRRG